MKKIFTLIPIILVCLISIGCNITPSTNSTKSTYEINTFDKASISDISLANGIISLTFTYSGENQLQLNDWFVLEIYKDGAWYTLPYDIDTDWPLLAYPVEPNQSKTHEYNLESVYKTLSAGKYRIVTEVSDFIETGNYTNYYLSAEFEIK